MDLPPLVGGNGESADEHEDPNNIERRRNRHPVDIVQQLEALFKDNPNPNENQRQQLSEELGLQPNQIKFWFQNKRTQAKAQDGRNSNTALKAENDKLFHENHAMRDAMKKIVCRKCEGLGYGEEARQQNLQRLRNQNSWLRNEYNKLVSIVSNFFQSRNIIPPVEFLRTPTSDSPNQVPNYLGEGSLGGRGSSEGTSNSQDTLFGINLNRLHVPPP